MLLFKIGVIGKSNPDEHLFLKVHGHIQHRVGSHFLVLLLVILLFLTVFAINDEFEWQRMNNSIKLYFCTCDPTHVQGYICNKTHFEKSGLTSLFKSSIQFSDDGISLRILQFFEKEHRIVFCRF